MPLSILEKTFARIWNHHGTGDAPDQEYRFLPDRDYRFDFAWPERMLAVEIQGGTWVKSGHSSGRGIQRDCEKSNLAVLAGWRVLHFTKQDLSERPSWCVGLVKRLLGENQP